MNKRIEKKMQKAANRQGFTFQTKAEFIEKAKWEQLCWDWGFLSEEFMEEFINYINFDSISQYQKLSEKFIRKHKDKLNMRTLASYQKLSQEFKKEFAEELGATIYILPDNSWQVRCIGGKNNQLGDTVWVEKSYCYNGKYTNYLTISEMSEDGKTIYLDIS